MEGVGSESNGCYYFLLWYNTTKMHCVFRLRSTNGKYVFSAILPTRRVYEQISYDTNEYQIYGYYLGLSRGNFRFASIKNQILDGNYTQLALISAYFLIVIFEKSRGSVRILTDQYGTFPCYCTVRGNDIFISPSLDIVRSKHGLPVNSQMLALHLVSHIPNEHTVFDKIYSCPPGTVTTVCFGSFRSDSYLTTAAFPPDERIDSPAAFARAFQDKLWEIFNDYLTAIGTAPFASDLTAGLDSSMVSYLLSCLSGGTVQTVTANYLDPYALEDERVIHEFAMKHNISTSIAKIQHMELESYIQQSASQYPYSSLQCIPIARYQRLGQLNRSVCFTGIGGDDLFFTGNIRKRSLARPYLMFYRMMNEVAHLYQTVLTKYGRDLVMDRSLFSELTVYPLVLHEQVVSTATMHYQWNTMYDIVELHPLADIRLVRLFHAYPRQEGVLFDKYQFWQEFDTDIYIQGQVKKPNRRSQKSFYEALCSSDTHTIQKLLESLWPSLNEIVDSKEIVRLIYEGKESLVYTFMLLRIFVISEYFKKSTANRHDEQPVLYTGSKCSLP